MSFVNSFADKIVAIVAARFPQLVYGSIYEYRIGPSSAAGRFDLVPVRTKLLGELPRVSQWGGPGIEAAYAAGASVLVAFADADDRYPVVVGYLPARSPGGKPTTLSIDALAINIGAGAKGAARIDDFVVRLYWHSVGMAPYYSTSTGAPYTWLPVASGIIPPTAADAGTAINITAGSVKVVVG